MPVSKSYFETDTKWYLPKKADMDRIPCYATVCVGDYFIIKVKLVKTGKIVEVLARKSDWRYVTGSSKKDEDASK